MVRLLTLLMTLAAACGTKNVEPSRIEVICGGNCDKSLDEVLAEFDRNGLNLPGSGLEVWLPDDDASSPYVSACVPLMWDQHAGGAKGAKDEFKAQLHQAVKALASGNRDRVHVGPPCRSAPNSRHDIRMLGSHAASQKLAGLSEANQGASHVAVLCDRSSNPQGIACTSERVAEVWEAWLISDLPEPGSTFTVYRVGVDSGSAAIAAELRIPNFESPAQTVAFALDQRRRLLNLLPANPEPVASAIAETLAWAVPRTLERPGRHRIVSITDLREYNRTGINFERSVPDPSAFINHLKTHHLFTTLDSANVTICGAFLKPDPRLADLARRTWKEALLEMGAGTVDITEQCPTTL